MNQLQRRMFDRTRKLGTPSEPVFTEPHRQQVVYRQLMYLVTIQSVMTALIGTRHRWPTINRTGVFADEVPPTGRPAGEFGGIGP